MLAAILTKPSLIDHLLLIFQCDNRAEGVSGATRFNPGSLEKEAFNYVVQVFTPRG